MEPEEKIVSRDSNVPEGYELEKKVVVGYDRTRPPVPEGGYNRTRPKPPTGGYNRSRPRPPSGGYNRQRPKPPPGGYNRSKPSPPCVYTFVKREEE